MPVVSDTILICWFVGNYWLECPINFPGVRKLRLSSSICWDMRNCAHEDLGGEEMNFAVVIVVNR